MESGQLSKITPQGAQANFRKAIDAGERGAILVRRDVLLLRGNLFVYLQFFELRLEVGSRSVRTTGQYSSSLHVQTPAGRVNVVCRILPLFPVTTHQAS